MRFSRIGLILFIAFLGCGRESNTQSSGTPREANYSDYIAALDPSSYRYYVFVANSGSSDVSVYSVNTSNGNLSAAATQATGAGTKALAVHPSGKFLYVATTAGLAVYSVTPLTGALTLVETETSGVTPSAIAFGINGSFLYSSNQGSNDVRVFSVDSTTGALTFVETEATGGAPVSVATNPAGTFLYTANSGGNTVSAFTIASDGTLTLAQTRAAGTAPSSLKVSINGKSLYVTHGTSNDVITYSVNASTGVLTEVETDATGNNPVFFAMDPAGWFGYAVNYLADTVSMFSVDSYSAYGSLGAIASSPRTIGAGTRPSSAVVDSSGLYLYVTTFVGNTVEVFTITHATGALTLSQSIAAGTGPVWSAFGRVRTN